LALPHLLLFATDMDESQQQAKAVYDKDSFLWQPF